MIFKSNLEEKSPSRLSDWGLRTPWSSLGSCPATSASRAGRKQSLEMIWAILLEGSHSAGIEPPPGAAGAGKLPSLSSPIHMAGAKQLLSPQAQRGKKEDN